MITKKELENLADMLNDMDNCENGNYFDDAQYLIGCGYRATYYTAQEVIEQALHVVERNAAVLPCMAVQSIKKGLKEIIKDYE